MNALRMCVCAGLCLFVASTGAFAQDPPTATDPSPAAAVTDPLPQRIDTTPGRKKNRAAEDAYLAGARRLGRNEVTGAEHEFSRALALDPDNPDYVVALSVAHEHRVTELVHEASKARLTGDPTRAETLLAEARAIDPENPILLEHSRPALAQGAQAGGQGPKPDGNAFGGQLANTLTDRARLLTAGAPSNPAKLPMPVLAGTVQLTPTDGLKSFHQRADQQTVLHDVAAAYGIRVVFDDSVERKNLRFDLEDQTYQRAMGILMKMTHVFAVPIDATSILLVKDDVQHRQLLERQVEETLYLPGLTSEQITEIANVVRNIFEVKQATVEASLQSIIVRAPEDVFGPMNRTIEGLIEGSGEVMIEVKLYSVDTTHTRNIGATIPQQFSTFNVQAEAANIVSQNQTLVQQAIAQGYVSATASNLTIALALIGSGLVQSSLTQNLLGVFGGGLIQTGITGSASTTLSLSLNSSDVHALDDVQVQVQDRQLATFRAGTKYPVTTSTYSTGLSTAASALSGATINGVSVASLLSQYSGGSSTTIPQVTYEDLGVTLKATPVIQKGGRINMALDMRIEALAGGSSNGIPVLASRQFLSTITVGDGESAMMVSQLTRTESAAVTGVPGLSELPGFQAPVDQNAEKDTSQLVVVVTPHVIRRRSDMVAGPRIVVREQEPGSPTN